MKVLFSIFQTQNRSNGGMISMSQIIESIDSFVEPVIVTNTGAGPFNERWAANGWRVHDVDVTLASSRTPLRKLRELWRSNVAVYRLVRRGGIGIVYCNDANGFWHAAPGGKLAGARLLFNIRGTLAENEYARSAWKWRIMVRAADRVVVLSNEMKKWVEDLLLRGRPDEKVQAVYSIVDTRRFYPLDEHARRELRRRLGLPAGKRVVLYVGAFNDIKDQPRFLEEVTARFRRDDDVLFCFLGDFHPERNDTARRSQEAVEQIGLQRVTRFQGFTDAIEEWYQAADVVALASRKEGLPRCMIEGLACGVPVITFAVCSTREILEAHQCGVVIGQGDYPAFAEALRRLLDNEERRERLGLRGAATIRNLFSREEVVRTYRRLFGLPEAAAAPPHITQKIHDM